MMYWNYAFNYAIIDVSRIGPPFYQFGQIVFTECQQWYKLNLVTLNWGLGEYNLHTSPCAYNSLNSYDQIRQVGIDYLSSNGYDVSTLSR